MPPPPPPREPWHTILLFAHGVAKQAIRSTTNAMYEIFWMERVLPVAGHNSSHLHPFLFSSPPPLPFLTCCGSGTCAFTSLPPAAQIQIMLDMRKYLGTWIYTFIDYGLRTNSSILYITHFLCQYIALYLEVNHWRSILSCPPFLPISNNKSQPKHQMRNPTSTIPCTVVQGWAKDWSLGWQIVSSWWLHYAWSDCLWALSQLNLKWLTPHFI